MSDFFRLLLKNILIIFIWVSLGPTYKVKLGKNPARWYLPLPISYINSIFVEFLIKIYFQLISILFLTCKTKNVRFHCGNIVMSIKSDLDSYIYCQIKVKKMLKNTTPSVLILYTFKQRISQNWKYKTIKSKSFENWFAT